MNSFMTRIPQRGPERAALLSFVAPSLCRAELKRCRDAAAPGPSGHSPSLTIQVFDVLRRARTCYLLFSTDSHRDRPVGSQRNGSGRRPPGVFSTSSSYDWPRPSGAASPRQKDILPGHSPIRYRYVTGRASNHRPDLRGTGRVDRASGRHHRRRRARRHVAPPVIPPTATYRITIWSTTIRCLAWARERDGFTAHTATACAAHHRIIIDRRCLTSPTHACRHAEAEEAGCNPEGALSLRPREGNARKARRIRSHRPPRLSGRTRRRDGSRRSRRRPDRIWGRP